MNILRRLALAALVVPPAATTAQPLPERFFPFVIPWDDATPGVATDLSGMNHVGRPLPRIDVRDGHFVEADTGRRVRFWATNFGANEAFPERADADAVAARLAKYGINLVRLHHLDNPWAISSRGSIWDPNQTKRVIDPVQLDKLHYLMAALARHGIYTNLNLKVSKTLSAADGAPEGTEALSSGVSTSFQKKVDRFHPFFIEHQKSFARQILTTPNPYRQNLPPATDPAVAFVEINNENAAAGWPGEAPGAGLASLPPTFRDELQRQWVVFLRQRYGSHAGLAAAWSTPSDRPGPTVLNRQIQWSVSRPGDTDIELRPGPADAAEPPDAPPQAQFIVSRATGVDWHAQGILPIPTLQADRPYTLEFEAQASPPRALRLSVDRNEPPWDNQGLNAVVNLTGDWERYRLVFQAGDAAVQRIALQLGESTGRVGLRAVRLFPGVVGEAIKPGESLDAATIPLPGGAALPAIQRDWQRFVTEVDRRFAETMLDFLVNDLGVKALIADTQIQWGGTGALAREARMHWTDSHAYWNHPIFIGGDWNPRNWTVSQTSLTNALGRGDPGTLGDLAAHRVAGKPFSVSEYDHPAPNDYVSEMMPLVSLFATLQDWDKVYTFAYAGFGPNAPTDRIQGFFDQSSHPAKWAFNPSAALIVREGLFDPLPADVTLTLPPDVHATVWTVANAWRRAGGVPNALTHRLAVNSDPAFDSIATRRDARTAPNSPVVLGSNPHGATLTAVSARAAVATGFLGGTAVQMGPFTLDLDRFGNQFASLTLVPLDRKPLAESGRLLLTLLGRAENLAMGWNADRTSVSDQWGSGPVHVEGIPATLTLPQGMTVHPLTPTGTRKPPLKPLPGPENRVRLSSDSQTVWYELVR